MSEPSIKYSTYLPHDVIAAVKRLAAHKGVSANYVIEMALRKKIPEKYWEDRYQEG